MKALSNQSTPEFNVKAFIGVSCSVSICCLVLIVVWVQIGSFAWSDFFRFDHPSRLATYIGLTSLALIALGVVVARFSREDQVDATNQVYQSYSFLTIFSFTLAGATFEELLFRGVVQNAASLMTEREWMTILIGTGLFLLIHFPYFKKPLMVINLTISSIAFGWVYIETQNMLAPILVHFLMNFVATLLFKYKVISLRRGL